MRLHPLPLLHILISPSTHTKPLGSHLRVPLRLALVLRYCLRCPQAHVSVQQVTGTNGPWSTITLRLPLVLAQLLSLTPVTVSQKQGLARNGPVPTIRPKHRTESMQLLKQRVPSLTDNSSLAPSRFYVSLIYVTKYNTANCNSCTTN